LSADERLDVGRIVLSPGAVSETVSVVAQSAVVHTTSAERSAMVTTQQLSDIQIRGRDYVSMLKTIPGFAWQADTESLAATTVATPPRLWETKPATTNNLLTAYPAMIWEAAISAAPWTSMRSKK